MSEAPEDSCISTSPAAGVDMGFSSVTQRDLAFLQGEARAQTPQE